MQSSAVGVLPSKKQLEEASNATFSVGAERSLFLIVDCRSLWGIFSGTAHTWCCLGGRIGQASRQACGHSRGTGALLASAYDRLHCVPLLLRKYCG